MKTLSVSLRVNSKGYWFSVFLFLDMLEEKGLRFMHSWTISSWRAYSGYFGRKRVLWKVVFPFKFGVKCYFIKTSREGCVITPLK